MTWVIMITGYLLGSIPVGYLASQWVCGADIRTLGDHNMGAANVYREVGHTAGIIVGLVDGAKGALPVLLTQALHLSPEIVLLTGLLTVAGHNFPIFLKFRGGRGVSTSVGVLLVVYTLPVLIMALPCLIVLKLTRSVTPAMAVFYIPLPVLGWWLGLPPLLIGYSILLPVAVGLTHLVRVKVY